MKKQPGYSILLGLTVVFFGLAILTAWPMHASKANILGYYSHCTWTPWSTIVLLVMAGGVCKIRATFFKKPIE